MSPLYRVLLEHAFDAAELALSGIRQGAEASSMFSLTCRKLEAGNRFPQAWLVSFGSFPLIDSTQAIDVDVAGA